MVYKYNDQYVSAEEMNEIEEMEAAWAAALEKKVEIVKKSMSNRFAFAFGPLYQVKESDNVPAEKKLEVIAKVNNYLEQACSINSYPNKFEELEANNNLPVDYELISRLKYDTVSYVMSSDDNDDSLVLAFDYKV